MYADKRLPPIAVQILCLIEKYGEMTVTEITNKGLNRSTASSCLRRLETAGILVSRTEKRSQPAFMGEPRMREVKVYSVKNKRENHEIG